MTNNAAANMMKALVIWIRPASIAAVSESVELANVPRPPLDGEPTKPSQLVVQIHAASLQIEDLYTATGRRPLLSITPTPTHPVTLGIEFTGTVVSCHESCHYQTGDVIMGIMTPIRVRRGCWAQYATVSTGNVCKVPSHWTKEQAAAFPMSCLVAQAAANYVEEPSKQRVAVVGASGCIGCLLVQLLASQGAHVVAVCSEANAEFVQDFCGAKEVCTRESGGLATYRASDDGRRDKLPLDYVLDCVGGDKVEADASKALRKTGHFITVVGPGEESFGGVDSTGGIGRGAAIAAKSLKAKWSGGISYTLASMSPFGVSTKLAEIADTIDKYNEGKGPTLRTRTVAANDMIAVRAAIDDVAKQASHGRVILDFTMLNDCGTE